MERNRRFALRMIQCLVGLLLLATALPAAAALPQSTFDPAGPVARMQLDLFNVTLWITVFIFIVVASGLGYAMIRFRGRPGDAQPKQIHGNSKLEVLWTVIPVILLLFIAVPTVNMSFQLAAAPSEDESIKVRVIGYQWWWAFEYPDLGIVTANELRIPEDTPVDLTLESEDVIHSFWIPRLAGKVDVVPNRVNTMWLQADEPGVYYGQCAEYCGTSHANMRMRVQVVSQAEFDAWVQQRQAAAAFSTADNLVTRGHDVFVNSACAACHTVDGTEAAGKVGPDLSDVGSRTTIAAGLVDNTPENMAAWLRDPQSVKPGALMPNLQLNDEDVSALVAFLDSLK